MKTRIAILSITLILLSCKDIGVELPSESEQDNLRESIYRYQMTGADTSKIYFLVTVKLDSETGKYKRVDPDDSFIDRFKDLPVKVKKYSDCDIFKGVFDKTTGKKGIILSTEKIQWISTSEAITYGGYEENGLSASGNRYRVQKLSGKWSVVESILIWIA